MKSFHRPLCDVDHELLYDISRYIPVCRERYPSGWTMRRSGRSPRWRQPASVARRQFERQSSVRRLTSILGKSWTVELKRFVVAVC